MPDPDAQRIPTIDVATRFYDFSMAGPNGFKMVSGAKIAREGSFDGDDTDGTDLKLNPSDPRYLECLALAHELKNFYPLKDLDPDVPKDAKIITGYENEIVMALNKKIHEQYGDYNPVISEMLRKNKNFNTHPSLHNDTGRENSANPVGLDEFARNELICRHYAPLMSALCAEAGMPVLCITGKMDNFAHSNGELKYSRDVTNPLLRHKRSDNTHMYTVSCLTGNVIDISSSSSTNELAYAPGAERISINQIIAGESIIMALGKNRLTTYTAAKRGDDGDFLETVQAYHRDHVRPAYDRLEAAITKGDAEKARQCCESFCYDKTTLRGALKQAFATQNLPLSKVLMGQVDFESARKQMLQTITPSVTPPDEIFTRDIIGTLNITPLAYLQEAAQSESPEHIALGLKMIGDLPKTPELKDALEWTAKNAKGNFSAARERITQFLEKEYRSVDTAAVFNTHNPPPLIPAEDQTFIEQLKRGEIYPLAPAPTAEGSNQTMIPLRPSSDRAR